jgi:hypothetical protein
MKKTRLLEIIREEITSVLNEASTTYAGKTAIDDLKKDPKFSTLSGDGKMDAEEKLKSGGTVTIGEEQLNETPIYDINDMEGFKSTLNKFREEGVSKSKALNLLLKKLEDEGTVDTNSLSKEYGVDTATFNNQEIRKFLNRPEDQMFTDKSGNELIDFSPFLDKSNKPKGPRTKPEGEKTETEPKEKTALPDSGVTKKEPAKAEPKEKEAKKEKPKAEPKKEPVKAEPKKAEPKSKESSEEKAEKAASKATSKLDRISDDKDALLKIQKQAGVKMKEIVGKMKELKGKEKEDLMDELKKVNKIKAEIDKKLDNLGY